MTEDFNPFSLKGKKVVITGASSGIGRQCAIDCSRMGATIVMVARNQDRLQETYRHLAGEGHVIFSVDLTVREQMGELCSQILLKTGKIDGLVHCAGISTTLPLKLMNNGKIEDLFKTNVYSAIELTRELSKLKFMNSRGSIVFLSSVMGCVGESGKFLYSMTKGALIAASRSLACEFAKREIRVNCISPGAILTPINESLPHMADPEQRKLLEDKHLFGLGRTSDISSGCIYLLSDASRWLTGQNLIIDGGYTAR